MFCRKKRLIARVQEMEERFDRLQAAVRALETQTGTPEGPVNQEVDGKVNQEVNGKENQEVNWKEKREENRDVERKEKIVVDKKVGEDYEVLREYMDSGRWRKDYEADEKGKLPAGMKRGVLSQDGLYDLLADAAELIGKQCQ